MNLNTEQLTVVYNHVKKMYPQEAVIVITKHNTAVPIDNIHSDPINHFKIDSRLFYSLDPIALIHSHPMKMGDNPSPDVMMYFDPRTPSKADMHMQQQLDMPFGIITYDGENMMDICWFPDLDAPLLERNYIHGVYDCYSIIRSYYHQKYNILLDDYPRSYNWWENDENLYAVNVPSSGFYEIKEQDLEEGDMIFISVSKGIESHGAIYLGKSQIMHHLAARLSTIDSYSRWRKKMTRYFRHKDKPKGKYLQ